MGRIWSIARLTVAEAIRRKVAILFILIMAAVLATLPFVMKGDNTLTGRIQTFLAYSMTTLSFLLCMLTILLGCGSVALEIRSRQIYLTGTKPVPRWQILFGKWLGIVLLDLVLLGVGVGAVYGVVKYLATLPGTNPDDAYVLHNEVLTARAGVEMLVPDFAADVERLYQVRREEGRVPVDDPVVVDQIKRDIGLRLRRDYLSVQPLATQSWEFTHLLVKREPGQFLHLRYKLSVSPEPPRQVVYYAWVVGDRSKDTGEVVIPRDDKVGIYNEMPIPADLVADDGSLRVTLVNVHPEDPERYYRAVISFSEEDKPLLLYRIGTFGGNLLRALIIIYCKLMFLAAVGVCASTFLGFPVACLVCMILFLAAAVSGFILESLDMIPKWKYIDDPLDYIGYVFRPLGLALYQIVPQLSKFNPVPTLVEGRAVTLLWVIDAIGKLVLIRVAILGLLAYVLFQRRELADASTT
ncbi:MAG: ABC transporter permease [Phycisphaerales bacterium]|nr:MAG: ABC transporter permease [Phycisphaerales bacterium]